MVDARRRVVRQDAVDVEVAIAVPDEAVRIASQFAQSCGHAVSLPVAWAHLVEDPNAIRDLLKV